MEKRPSFPENLSTVTNKNSATDQRGSTLIGRQNEKRFSLRLIFACDWCNAIERTTKLHETETNQHEAG